MKAEFKPHTKIIRDEWDALVRASPQGNCYALSHYMDLVAPEWSGVEVFEKEKLVAVMPLHVRKRRGFLVSLQPPFSQYWGICFEPRSFSSTYKRYSWQRKVVQAVVEALPENLRWFAHSFSPHFDYPLPFHWQGHSLKTRYTYVLDLEASEQELWKGLGKNTKYEINKASELQLREAANGDGLLELVKRNGEAGKQLLTATEGELLGKIMFDALKHKEGYVLEMTTPDGGLSAAGFFLEFEGRTVYLMSAQNPTEKQNGAMTRLIWEAMKKGLGKGRLFDFEGSMMEGVEGFFRGFGAGPIPYLFIEKNDLPLWVKWIRRLR